MNAEPYSARRSALSLSIALAIANAAAMASLAAPSPIAAQERSSEPGRAGVDRIASRIAELWRAGEITSLEGMMDAGVALFIVHTDHGTLPPSRAVAALREARGGYVSGEVELSRASLVDGSAEGPDMGFGELRWRTVASGTSEIIEYTVYIGLIRRPGAWKVYEVRLLR